MDYIWVRSMEHGSSARIDFDTNQYDPVYDDLMQLGNTAYLNGELSYVDLNLLDRGIIVLIRNSSGQLHGDFGEAIKRFIDYIRALPCRSPAP